MTENSKSYIYVAIAVLSWSTVATMFKISLKYFSHFEMLLVASFTALVVYAVTLLIQNKWKLLKDTPPKEWLRFALVSLLNPVSYYLILFKSYALLPAQIAQPINYFWPIILLILLAIVARKSIPAIKYIGMLMSFVGVVIISLGTGGLAGRSLPVGGLLLALLSAFIWATYWIVNNQNKHTDSVVALFITFLFGSVYLLFISFFMNIDLRSMQGLMSSMYVGVCEMGIPFIFFGLAIKKTSNSTLVNQLCYLAPFISLYFIHLILGEQILTSTYIGLLLIVVGIIFNEYLSGYITKKKMLS